MHAFTRVHAGGVHGCECIYTCACGGVHAFTLCACVHRCACISTGAHAFARACGCMRAGARVCRPCPGRGGAGRGFPGVPGGAGGGGGPARPLPHPGGGGGGMSQAAALARRPAPSASACPRCLPPSPRRGFPGAARGPAPLSAAGASGAGAGAAPRGPLPGPGCAGPARPGTGGPARRAPPAARARRRSRPRTCGPPRRRREAPPLARGEAHPRPPGSGRAEPPGRGVGLHVSPPRGAGGEFSPTSHTCLPVLQSIPSSCLPAGRNPLPSLQLAGRFKGSNHGSAPREGSVPLRSGSLTWPLASPPNPRGALLKCSKETPVRWYEGTTALPPHPLALPRGLTERTTGSV